MNGNVPRRLGVWLSELRAITWGRARLVPLYLSGLFLTVIAVAYMFGAQTPPLILVVRPSVISPVLWDVIVLAVTASMVALAALFVDVVTQPRLPQKLERRNLSLPARAVDATGIEWLDVAVFILSVIILVASVVWHFWVPPLGLLCVVGAIASLISRLFSAAIIK